MHTLNWGILSTAKIGVVKVIPAMQQSEKCSILAIASREEKRARAAAKNLDIPRAYGSYDELLTDKDVHAIYNPLPNHLHISWTIRALHAGKHVLCEKPIALSADEAAELAENAKMYPDLKVMEAFMYRFHPQWIKAKDLVKTGEIGDLKTIQTFFCYHNFDPEDVRNIAEYGGGGLLDIGCYPISVARFLFDDEPTEVFGHMDFDPAFKTDILTSVILKFDQGRATFSVGTQLEPYQRVLVFGTDGQIEIDIPFNAPHDKPTRLWLKQQGNVEEIKFDVCNQYKLQGDAFSQAVLKDEPVPTPLEDAVANMRVIDAVIKSHSAGMWIKP